jgi:AcrR family transcriptional regulator
MNKPERIVVRRRNDAEETRRRVLDAVVATVVEVGYYKASSNEIARRAGVTWGSIQHLFGSREQLMLDVVNDIAANAVHHFVSADIKGKTLEERLHEVLKVLAVHYEQDTYLVQLQILMDLSANPKVPARGRRAIQRKSNEVFDQLAQPLFSKALGSAADHDLILFAFLTMRGYLTSFATGRRIAEMPDDVVYKFIGKSVEDAVLRNLLVEAIAAKLRQEAAQRGLKLD